jgi:Core-2/I-Branching enzyme
MKIAHLLFTYTNPLQTERLVKKLMHEDADFYIQLDKKMGLETHRNLSKYENVYFVKNRVDVKWGGYSMVQSVFNALEEILSRNERYGFINLLSGQDYPIKSTPYIMNFLKKNIGSNFLAVKHFNTEWPEGLKRVNRYHMTDYGFKGRYLTERTLNFLMPERKCPLGLEYYGESMFWTISPEAAAYVLNFVTKNKKYTTFLRHTWSPSEFIFQTVLMNSPFQNTIIKEDLMEVEFPAGAARPKIYTSNDFIKLKKSKKLFARKFNIEVDATILDKLDLLITESITGI